MSESTWFAANPSKRWCEKFTLAYSPVWMIACLGIVVPFQYYEAWDEWGYLACGVCAAAPLVIVPAIFPGAADQGKPWNQRYWVKAAVWQAIFGFIGNYFWTHYFFQILGAAYTMPSHRLNNIPIVMFLMTHAYFSFYHVVSNIAIRKTLSATRAWGITRSWIAASVVIFVLAYVTAFMETFTIAQYPYYSFQDKGMMYTVGSLFYAIYFWVSFPAFFLMDEDVKAKRHPLWRAAWDALASGMLVTIILDFWRIFLGPIYEAAEDTGSLPFMKARS